MTKFRHRMLLLDSFYTLVRSSVLSMLQGRIIDNQSESITTKFTATHNIS